MSGILLEFNQKIEVTCTARLIIFDCEGSDLLIEINLGGGLYYDNNIYHVIGITEDCLSPKEIREWTSNIIDKIDDLYLGNYDFAGDLIFSDVTLGELNDKMGQKLKEAIKKEFINQYL